MRLIRKAPTSFCALLSFVLDIYDPRNLLIDGFCNKHCGLAVKIANARIIQ